MKELSKLANCAITLRVQWPFKERLVPNDQELKYIPLLEEIAARRCGLKCCPIGAMEVRNLLSPVTSSPLFRRVLKIEAIRFLIAYSRTKTSPAGVWFYFYGAAKTRTAVRGPPPFPGSAPIVGDLFCCFFSTLFSFVRQKKGSGISRTIEFQSIQLYQGSRQNTVFVQLRKRKRNFYVHRDTESSFGQRESLHFWRKWAFVGLRKKIDWHKRIFFPKFTAFFQKAFGNGCTLTKVVVWKLENGSMQTAIKGEESQGQKMPVIYSIFLRRFLGQNFLQLCITGSSYMV